MPLAGDSPRGNDHVRSGCGYRGTVAAHLAGLLSGSEDQAWPLRVQRAKVLKLLDTSIEIDGQPEPDKPSPAALPERGRPESPRRYGRAFGMFHRSWRASARPWGDDGRDRRYLPPARPPERIATRRRPRTTIPPRQAPRPPGMPTRASLRRSASPTASFPVPYGPPGLPGPAWGQSLILVQELAESLRAGRSRCPDCSSSPVPTTALPDIYSGDTSSRCLGEGPYFSNVGIATTESRIGHGLPAGLGCTHVPTRERR
jgi:hypothetical protein